MRWLWPLALGLWLTVVLVLRQAYQPEYDGVVRVWPRSAMSQTLLPETITGPGTLAERYSAVLNDLIRTDGFLLRVIEQTPLRAVAVTPASQAQVIAYLSRRLAAQPKSASVIEIHFVTDRTDLIAPVLNAVVTAAGETTVLDERAQANVALAFYTPQMKQAEAAWLAADGALRAYLAAYGDLAETQLIASGPLSELQQREQRARRAYDDLVARIDHLHLTSAAREASLGTTLRIVDPPVVPTHPRPAWVVLGWRVAAASVLLLTAVIGAVLLVTWLDDALHAPADVTARLGIPLLGSLPRPRRRWRPGRAGRSPALPTQSH